MEDVKNPAGRQATIAHEVARRGGVRVEEFAQMLDVSLVTVYRDLRVLEEQKLVELDRGYVRPRLTSGVELPPGLRRLRESEVKAALSVAALELINPGDTVMIDDSSTCLPLANAVPEKGNVTVISNSMVIARELTGCADVEFVLIGGRYYPWAQAFYGSLARDMVGEIQADICLMSEASVGAGGVYNPLDYVVDMKRAMLAHSHKHALLVDATKFTRRAWQRTAPLSAFDYVITDVRLPEEAKSMVSDAGAELILVDVPSQG